MTNTTVQYELNRLAGTLKNGVPSLSAQAAANVWTVQPMTYDMVGALNRYAGISNPKDFIGFREVCNLLAGTTNEDPALARSLIGWQEE